MQNCNSNCTSPASGFDVAQTHRHVFKRKPLDTFKSIKVILTVTFEEEHLEGFFWTQSDVFSCWNIYMTDSAREGGSLDINNPVFEQHQTKDHGLHIGQFTGCTAEEACDCIGYNFVVAQSTIEIAAAAASTAKSLEIPLIAIVPPTPTPFAIDADSWYWEVYVISYDGRIKSGYHCSPGLSQRRRMNHSYAQHHSRRVRI